MALDYRMVQNNIFTRAQVEVLGKIAPMIRWLLNATGAVERSVHDKLSDAVSVKDFGAVGDGVSNDKAAIQAALDCGARFVTMPAGTYSLATGLMLPAGVTLDGNGSTIKVPQGVNAVIMDAAGGGLRNMVLDGTSVDDIVGATGVILGSDGTLMNVHCQNFGFHGFATPTGVGSHRNALIGCRATNTGHRGINLSNGSTYNRVTNFEARGCKRAGIILGYKSNYNTFSNIYIDGHSTSVGGAGLWVHMNSNYNEFIGVQIGEQDGTGTTAPSMILAGGCKGNTFACFRIIDAGTRGVLLWNLAVDHLELGTADAPLDENRFIDFVVLGQGLASSDGIVIQSDDSLYCVSNYFHNFYIDGFVDAVDDIDSLSDKLEFRDFKFGPGISGRKMRVGTTADNFRNSRRFNCQGLTGVGVLTADTTEYGQQPAVPASGGSVTQCYPFPVNVYVQGLPSGANVTINGGNILGTAPNNGNGVHTVLPGQTIGLNYASGTPTWRWWGL